jgi:hypothetical protein
MTGGSGRDSFTCDGGRDLFTDFDPRLDLKSFDCEDF